MTKDKPALNAKWIDSRALDIIKRLQGKGYSTYLVGGCVRDLLLGIYPKDFDVVTSAHPRQIRRIIPNSYVIGRRFCLVLVKRGEDQFEVSTFRRNSDTQQKTDIKSKKHSPILRDNLFGTPIEDANRRDFTINSLFYDPFQERLIDYCNGLKDIQSRVIRMIGDPYERIPEDPIRILRSLRLAHKLQFSIHPHLREAISVLSENISLSILPRKREEMLKILRLHNPIMALQEIYDLKVMKYAWPRLHTILEDDESRRIFWSYCRLISEIREEDNHFKNKHTIEQKPNSVELFSLLALSLFVAQNIYDPLKVVSSGAYSGDPELKIFMKEELGMFSWEITEVLKGLEILPSLKGRYDIFKAWHKTRQKSFLKQKGFATALHLATIEQTLPYWEIVSWVEEYQKAHK